jgi:protein-tyrosine kinase
VDRLEKALQKAREERERVVAGPGTAAIPVAPEAADAVKTRRSHLIELTDQALEQNRVVARMAHNPNADIFRILRTKVLRHLTEANLTTVAVTSANHGEGKTTIAVNLALSLALDVKQTVLLVDLDLRDPSVHRWLGIEPELGLSDYFQNDAPLADCLVDPRIERLKVLPVHQPLEMSSETLGTPKMAKLANELKTRYPDRIVIYDMPPLLAQDDVIAFLPHVDSVLLVVREGITHAEDVRQCMNVLDGANLIGTVLNNATERMRSGN